MVPRRGDAVCSSRRCELHHLAAWAERVITRRQINVSVDRVGVRHPRLQQFSPRLVAGSRQYPRVGEIELMAFLQRVSGDLRDFDLIKNEVAIGFHRVKRSLTANVILHNADERAASLLL
ncbi:hypothetical protein SprV_0401656600 [Sparganum proliferum]